MSNSHARLCVLKLESKTLISKNLTSFDKNQTKKVEFMVYNDEEVIKKMIEEAYINGIHRDQDRSKVDKGFHQDFAMLVLVDNKITKVDVDEWLKRISKMKKENPNLWNSKTTYDFKLVDVTGTAAVAKLDVYKGATHFSTDYMLLYKFEEGWRIVSKIFTIP